MLARAQSGPDQHTGSHSIHRCGQQLDQLMVSREASGLTASRLPRGEGVTVVKVAVVAKAARKNLALMVNF